MLRKWIVRYSQALISLLIATATTAQTLGHADRLAPRRGRITVWVSDAQREPAAHVRVTVRQIRHEFLFGATMPPETFATEEDEKRTAGYLNFFRDHFTAVATGDSLSWSRLPPPPVALRWETFEPLITWARRHSLLVHAQRVFSGRATPSWVQHVAPTQCLQEVHACALSLAETFRLQFASCEVAGELLDCTACGSPLLMATHALTAVRNEDPDARLFVWESQLIGNGERTAQWADAVNTLLAMGAPIQGLAIMVGPIDHLPPEALTLCMDALAQIGQPVYLTDIAISGEPDIHVAAQLKNWLTAAFAHPAVQGIFLADPRISDGSPSAKLLYPDGTRTAVGEVFQKLVFQDWQTTSEGMTDSLGRFECEGFFGEYEISALDKSGAQTVITTKVQRALGQEMISLHLPPPGPASPTNLRSSEERSMPKPTDRDDINQPVRR